MTDLVRLWIASN